jgi:hypothetical protein
LSAVNKSTDAVKPRASVILVSRLPGPPFRRDELRGGRPSRAEARRGMRSGLKSSGRAWPAIPHKSPTALLSRNMASSSSNRALKKFARELTRRVSASRTSVYLLICWR